jgi:hypothetical protein
VANPRVADGYPPEGRIIMNPNYQLPIYYPFSVCLIMASTFTEVLLEKKKKKSLKVLFHVFFHN